MAQAHEENEMHVNKKRENNINFVLYTSQFHWTNPKFTDLAIRATAEVNCESCNSSTSQTLIFILAQEIQSTYTFHHLRYISIHVFRGIGIPHYCPTSIVTSSQAINYYRKLGAALIFCLGL